MAKAQLKTQKNDASVSDFLSSISDEQQRADSLIIDEMMRTATGQQPTMWGSNMIGYGLETLTYASGRELEWFKIGFSPRKQNLSLYVLMCGGPELYEDLLAKLGKHSAGKGCLYIKRLSDIDISVLKKIIELAAKAKHAQKLD